MFNQLTKKEQERLAVIVINETLSGSITKAQAAVMLGISTRLVKRLKSKIRENGSLAIVHQLKGKQSNHHIADTVKKEALQVIREKYADFRPNSGAA